MPIKYSDEKLIKARAMLKERDALIAEVSKISKEIARLTKLREDTRTQARRLKSAAIAYELGVTTSWVKGVAEGRLNRNLPN
jgi:hypothetical protein